MKTTTARSKTIVSTIPMILTCMLVLSLTATTKAANITCFGDSITAGHSSRSGGYPPKLSNLLNSNGKPSNVINKGISGEKTPAGVARFDGVLASWPANIVLIMEGTNDIRGGLSLQTTQYNLQAMINKSKAAGVTPVLATLTPSNRSGSETLIPNVWNPMIASLASSNGVLLADQYAGILPTWSGSNADGLHPNDTGYQTVAVTWYNTIAALISSTGEVNASSGGGGGGGGCFIATAAFGSPVQKHVRLLKDFRDQFLLSNTPGRLFVRAYYRYSPPFAEYISDHDVLKGAVRVMLYPLVGLSYVLLKLSLPLQLVLMGLIGSGLFFSGRLVYTRRKRCS